MQPLSPSSASYVPEDLCAQRGGLGEGTHTGTAEGRREPHACAEGGCGGGGEHELTLGSAKRQVPAEGQEARPGFPLLQLLCNHFLCQACLCLLASRQLAMAGQAHRRSLPSLELGWRQG